METTKDTIVRLLAESMEMAPEDIEENMNLVDDLDFDSFSIVKFVISIEDTYHITFDEFSEMTQHMETVGELIAYVESFVLIHQD